MLLLTHEQSYVVCTVQESMSALVLHPHEARKAQVLWLLLYRWRNWGCGKGSDWFVQGPTVSWEPRDTMKKTLDHRTEVCPGSHTLNSCVRLDYFNSSEFVFFICKIEVLSKGHEDQVTWYYAICKHLYHIDVFYWSAGEPSGSDSGIYCWSYATSYFGH